MALYNSIAVKTSRCLGWVAQPAPQPLSALLKLTGAVNHLSLYDIVGAKGVAADVGGC